MCCCAGRVTGNVSVTGSNLTYASPGTYTYTHVVRAMERLNYTVTLEGSLVGESQLVNVTSALPSAVNVGRSLAAVTVLRSGEANRTMLSATGPLAVSAYSWHLLQVPVFLFGRVASTFANPRLGARLTVTLPVTVNVAATNTSSATWYTTTETVVFNGYWSSSNASYVVPFKLSALGNITGVVQLLSNVTANTTMVS